KELDAVGFDALKIDKLGDIGDQRQLEVFDLHESTSVDQVVEDYINVNANNASVCTECGNMTLVYAEGCEKCVSCGYSKC
ncbi:hypothetical protein CO178_00195, partial [candidate division WWE3 bacterium CG_4_9_14_3_um_filter_34_6]